MDATKPARFMIISDTHSHDFKDRANEDVPFQHPLPRCDVLLHAGDLTNRGTTKELEQVINMLGSIDAELKLVIAGNHDLTLDGEYWKRMCKDFWTPTTADNSDPDSEDDAEVASDHEKAVGIMTGLEARKAGVIYLEEGLHTFTLKSGATFTIYASPWQPEFCNMAFNYHRSLDRFNPTENVADAESVENSIKIPENGVDIMMTHGPPRGILDGVKEGRMTAHVGCSALMTAFSRARPQLYGFGHIHEGYGAERITWTDSKQETGEEAIASRLTKYPSFPEPLDARIQIGKTTLMVNAAIKTIRYKPLNAPWIVDLNLKMSRPATARPFGTQGSRGLQ